MVLNIKVLCVTKDWRLAEQCKINLLRLNPALRIGRIGGDSDKLLVPEVNANEKFNGVAFTTLSTIYSQLKNNDCRLTTTLLIWDECHWGQRTKMGRKILKYCKKNNISILGLTATPLENDAFRVEFYRSFFDLVKLGWLAEPIFEEPVTTGVEWSPGLNARSGDFTSMSLRQLAVNANRNRLIVGYYDTHCNRFGQTLVFACNIEHANLLVQIFTQHGVTVAPIHGAVKEVQRNRFLQEFRDANIRVLVSVEMLTHGIDLPTVKTIFLCRPTTSDILFTQMLGRGARIQEGKTKFYVVEFTDNVKKHSDVIINAKTHFKGAGVSASTQKYIQQTNGRNQHHGFDPNGLAVTIPDDPSFPESIRGLWLRRGQTFGIEIELTRLRSPNSETVSTRWIDTANELIKILRTVVEHVADKPITGYAGYESGYKKDFTLWNLESDASAGWEITSPILSGIDGYLEAAKVFEVLDKEISRLGLDVNFKTGTHVHLGWKPQSLVELKRFLRLVRLAEPGLGTLVAPSRLADFNGKNYDLEEPNMYCKPISYVATEAHIRSWKSLADVEESLTDRHVTFNLRPLFKQGTVEVRMHSGTVEARKIMPFVSLIQQSIWAASIDRIIPKTEDRFTIIPDGDIVEFARAYLPSENEPNQAAFLRRLDARRREILELWRQSSKLCTWTEFRQNWKPVA